MNNRKLLRSDNYKQVHKQLTNMQTINERLNDLKPMANDIYRRYERSRNFQGTYNLLPKMQPLITQEDLRKLQLRDEEYLIRYKKKLQKKIDFARKIVDRNYENAKLKQRRDELGDLIKLNQRGIPEFNMEGLARALLHNGFIGTLMLPFGFAKGTFNDLVYDPFIAMKHYVELGYDYLENKFYKRNELDNKYIKLDRFIDAENKNAVKENFIKDLIDLSNININNDKDYEIDKKVNNFINNYGIFSIDNDTLIKDYKEFYINSNVARVKLNEENKKNGYDNEIEETTLFNPDKLKDLSKLSKKLKRYNKLSSKKKRKLLEKLGIVTKNALSDTAYNSYLQELTIDNLKKLKDDTEFKEEYIKSVLLEKYHLLSHYTNMTNFNIDVKIKEQTENKLTFEIINNNVFEKDRSFYRFDVSIPLESNNFFKDVDDNLRKSSFIEYIAMNFYPSDLIYNEIDLENIYDKDEVIEKILNEEDKEIDMTQEIEYMDYENYSPTKNSYEEAETHDNYQEDILDRIDLESYLGDLEVTFDGMEKQNNSYKAQYERMVNEFGEPYSIEIPDFGDYNSVENTIRNNELDYDPNTDIRTKTEKQIDVDNYNQNMYDYQEDLNTDEDDKYNKYNNYNNDYGFN